MIDETPAAYKPIDAVMAAQKRPGRDRAYAASGRVREGMTAMLTIDGSFGRRRRPDSAHVAGAVDGHRQAVPHREDPRRETEAGASPAASNRRQGGCCDRECNRRRC